ncbi:hypothetical protein PF005_g4186 [Phytophthora fragariae]|uniref:Secreted protein n=1 Tax=Phytophthora fragariae TaxID=53985 RepID=A0A6A3Z3R3_9STRA|nr:hypothetical protein PF007_g13250 [Phytophthora fragariae]KAE9109815.1 hypothetical protein PF010_g11393 [Phytophthora fragariae]KAE9228739.1 hypothetical protein PF005_g4186 [Phytophthora fragariae]
MSSSPPLLSLSLWLGDSFTLWPGAECWIEAKWSSWASRLSVLWSNLVFRKLRGTTSSQSAFVVSAPCASLSVSPLFSSTPSRG